MAAQSFGLIAKSTLIHWTAIISSQKRRSLTARYPKKLGKFVDGRLEINNPR